MKNVNKRIVRKKNNINRYKNDNNKNEKGIKN